MTASGHGPAFRAPGVKYGTKGNRRDVTFDLRGSSGAIKDGDDITMYMDSDAHTDKSKNGKYSYLHMNTYHRIFAEAHHTSGSEKAQWSIHSVDHSGQIRAGDQVRIKNSSYGKYMYFGGGEGGNNVQGESSATKLTLVTKNYEVAF